MGMRFFAALLIAFFATIAVLGGAVAALGGAGYAFMRLALSPERELFRAVTFATPAFELELAPGWWCELDGSEYVCSPGGKPPYAAIAVIAMKERSDNDNLAAYEQHLEQAQQPGVIGNNTAEMSQVRYVRHRILAGHEWVEALHSGSEIPNYDTYYLGTTTSNLGILVTMSVHKDHAGEYIAQLQQMMETLNVYQR
jgi:hypothetical protein